MFKDSVRFVILFCFFSYVSELSASTEMIVANPKITRVTVFTNNAMIRKEGKVFLKKGENMITIPDLTPNLIDNSVQVKISGTSTIKISDVKIKQTYLQKLQHDNIEKLQSKLDQIAALIKSDIDEVSTVMSSNDFLKRTIPFSQNQKVLPSEIEAHTKFLEKTLSENYSRIAKIDAHSKELQKEKSLIEKELNTFKAPEESKSVQIELFSSADLKDQKVEISYIVNNAHWNPLYIVHVDSNSGKVEWSNFASISQSSGEDWTEASIEISTAKPFSAKAPDPLERWYIDIYHPSPRSYSKSAFEQLKMMDQPVALSVMPESYSTPVTQQESTSFSFILPGKNTIPSDNQPHKVFISSAEKEVNFHYRTVPRVSSFAYLTADLESPFSFPLLVGEITLLLDGSVVGIHNTSKTIFPKEEIQLSLGADESIKIEYKQQKYSKQSRFISNDIHVQYSNTYEITNGKNKAIRINVEDHIPVSRNEQIKVVLDTPQKEAAQISEDGIIIWDVELSAQEKKILPMQFTVTYPKEIQIEGLE